MHINITYSKQNTYNYGMDVIDIELLRLLQKDALLPLTTLAKQVGLSASSVHARVGRLRSNGSIRRTVAVLDGGRLGCGMTVFVEAFIESSRHERAFVEAVRGIPEVLELHYVTGEASCLLKVKTDGLASLKALVLDRINAVKGVRQTRTVVVLSTVKEETALNLPSPKGGA